MGYLQGNFSLHKHQATQIQTELSKCRVLQPLRSCTAEPRYVPNPSPRTTARSTPRLTATFQILYTGKWLSREIICSKRTTPEHASRIPKMTADSLSSCSAASNAVSHKQGVCPSPIRFAQGAQPPLSRGLKPSFPHQNQFCQMSDAPSQENCLNGATPQPEGIQQCRALLHTSSSPSLP